MAEAALLDGLSHAGPPLGPLGRPPPLRPQQSGGANPAEPSGRVAGGDVGPPGLGVGKEGGNGVGGGRPASLAHWDIVRKRIVSAVGASLGFRTLRDMYGDFMLDPGKLTWVKTLGEGNYARVDKYRYADEPGGESFLAIKRLKSSKVSAQDMLDFMREVELLKKLSHESIATYKGSGTLPSEDGAQDDDLYLATECLDGGTLRDVLIKEMQAKHHSHQKYTLLQAADWMLDVARGMAYLHNAEPVVIHRDLKLENIMLNSQGRAKIVDFGLHKVIDRWLREYVKDEEGLYEMSGGMGAYIYMAPESLKSNRYNHLVDVYAFGIILWELMHYEMLINRVSLHGTTDDLKNFAKFVSREAWRPPISNDLPKGIVKLIEDCWSQSPSDRPEFKDIVRRLREVIAELKEQEMQQCPEKQPSGQQTPTPRDYDRRVTSSQPEQGVHPRPADRKAWRFCCF
ncbi:unnamed protein product [Ostreobium quekettii]|uniref:Protein kinase domain-containing protein n=1 Tax=Ostreobium quekettii TaxID=121088 RepID=A0A8S1IVB8_9CHLO|nr:unnamed protein product [Ostreobium quekettii]